MVLWKAAACGRLALDYCLFKVNWKQVRSHNAEAKIVFTSLLTYSTFRCTHLHFMPRYHRQRESLFRAHSLAPFFWFKPQLYALQPLVSRWEHKSALSERTFPSLHKTHFNSTSSHYASTFDWNSLHFSEAAAFFFVLCICMTRPKLMLAYVKCAAMGDTKWSWQNIIQLTVVPLL